MGEESKVRVKTMHQHRYNPENPLNPDSKIQNAARHDTHTRHCGLDPQSRRVGCTAARHTGFKAVSTWGDTRTDASHPALWIAGQVRNDGLWLARTYRIGMISGNPSGARKQRKMRHWFMWSARRDMKPACLSPHRD